MLFYYFQARIFTKLSHDRKIIQGLGKQLEQQHGIQLEGLEHCRSRQLGRRRKLGRRKQRQKPKRQQGGQRSIKLKFNHCLTIKEYF